MGIPTISPYSMPVAAELPANRAGWLPDPRRCALLIHDMQQYFVDFFPVGQPPVTELVPNIAQLREWAGQLGVPVVYTGQPGAMTREQRGLLRDIWGPGMNGDPRDRQIVDALTPDAREPVLTKWRYSAFFNSGLREILDAHQRDQLVIAGVYAHVGVLMTAMDAFSMDIEAFLVADAIADFSPDEHRMALDWAARRCAVVLTTADVGAALAVG